MPSYEFSRKHDNDEGHVDKTRLGGHVIDIGNPQLIWTLRCELSINQVQGIRHTLIWGRRNATAPSTNALNSQALHQPRNVTASHGKALSLQYPYDNTGTAVSEQLPELYSDSTLIV